MIAKSELNHQSFRIIFENSPAIMLLIDPSSYKIVAANKAAEDFYGWERSELESMSINDINNPSSEKIKAEIEKALKSEQKSVSFEHQLVSGEIRAQKIFLASTTPITVKMKRMVLVTLQDITERRKAENAMQESEERFRLLIENAPMSVNLLQKGKYIYSNPAAARLLGYENHEELFGVNALDTIAPEFHELILSRIKNIESGEKNQPIEIQVLKKGHGYKWSETVSVPVTLNGEKCAIIVGKDITDRRQAEEALKTKIDELERFQNLTVGRESAMIELKKEVNELLKRNGQAPKYNIVEYPE